MLNPNFLRPKVPGSLSHSQGFTQTLKLFAMSVVCLVFLGGTSESLFAQPQWHIPKFGEGSIKNFNRFVNGKKSNIYNPGDRIWIEAEADGENTEPVDQVKFTLHGDIRNYPLTNPVVKFAEDQDTSAHLNPGGTCELSIDTSKQNKYWVPNENHLDKYFGGVSLGSENVSTGIAGRLLDHIGAEFEKR